MRKIIAALLSITAVACQHGETMIDYDKLPVREGGLDEMVYSRKSTEFSVWAPMADAVTLRLYAEGSGDAPAHTTVKMKAHRDGSWSAKVRGDLAGSFYTFQVRNRGVELKETPGIMAKAVGVNGRRAAVIDLRTTDPEGWSEDRRPELKSFADVVLYELQHRDFSIDSLSGIENRGKFLALTEENALSGWGESTGIDHLVELGVNHIHLMPSYDFGSIDEEHLEENVYNWGYDPVNYNVPEGSYSTDPYDPGCRIREFKQMVQSLHKHGLRVVMDVVYNHTFNVDDSQFTLTAPGYFYRMREDGTLSDGSGCGNETASERAMMRRFIIESVKYWINEYHIDGFRFDLMGVHDIETVNAIRSAVDEIDPSIFIYGEGWAAGSCAIPEDRQAVKANIAALPRVAAFGDELRDAVRGPFNDDSAGAFLAGVIGHEESIKFGLVGAIEHPQIDYSSVNYSDRPWAEQPYQMISYISCHDDMCIYDRLRSSFDADDATRVKAVKLGLSIALLSQGVPFIYCGEEMLRDKNFVHNSFKSPDSVNKISWYNKTAHHDVFAYIRDIIELRKVHPAFRMGDARLVRENMEFLPVDGSGLIAYILKNHAAGDEWGNIIVAFNSRQEIATVEIPHGSYTVVCRGGGVDPMGITAFTGSQVSVAPMSTLIMYSE